MLVWFVSSLARAPGSLARGFLVAVAGCAPFCCVLVFVWFLRDFHRNGPIFRFTFSPAQWASPQLNGPVQRSSDRDSWLTGPYWPIGSRRKKKRYKRSKDSTWNGSTDCFWSDTWKTCSDWLGWSSVSTTRCSFFSSSFVFWMCGDSWRCTLWFTIYERWACAACVLRYPSWRWHLWTTANRHSEDVNNFVSNSKSIWNWVLWKSSWWRERTNVWALSNGTTTWYAATTSTAATSTIAATTSSSAISSTLPQAPQVSLEQVLQQQTQLLAELARCRGGQDGPPRERGMDSKWIPAAPTPEWKNWSTRSWPIWGWDARSYQVATSSGVGGWRTEHESSKTFSFAATEFCWIQPSWEHDQKSDCTQGCSWRKWFWTFETHQKRVFFVQSHRGAVLQRANACSSGQSRQRDKRSSMFWERLDQRLKASTGCLRALWWETWSKIFAFQRVINSCCIFEIFLRRWGNGFNFILAPSMWCSFGMLSINTLSARVFTEIWRG